MLNLLQNIKKLNDRDLSEKGTTMKKLAIYLTLILISIILFFPIILFLFMKGLEYLLILIEKYTHYINLFFNDMDVSANIAALSIGLALFIFILSCMAYLRVHVLGSSIE